MTHPDDGPRRYEHLDFNSPLSSTRADEIASRVSRDTPVDILDVGCGWGELLLRIAELSPNATGVGIDSDERALVRGRANAEARGLAERVTFKDTVAEEWSIPADIVVCIGSSHAFGDTARAMAALRDLVRPGGRLIFGEGSWAPVANADLSLVPDDITRLPDVAGLVDLAIAAGFRPVHVETASTAEWETFESGYLADREEWLLEHPRHPDAAEVKRQADAHRNRWLRGYRGSLGFAYLTLGVPVEA